MLTHLLFFLSSLVFTQYHPQEWGSITSLLTPTGIQATSSGIVYASTSGGLLQFDPTTEKISAKKMEEGLVYLDLSTIEVDGKDRLWLGGSYPNGYLQVYDPNNGMVRKITHLDIAQISKIQIGEDIAFAVYEGATSSDIGILEFTLDSDGLPVYRDYYNNFISGTSVTDIWDLDFFMDSVFVTTDQGLFSGNYKEDNLKSTANWVHIDIDDSVEQFVPANNPFIVTNSSILQRKNGSWNEYYTGFTSEPIQAELNDEKIAVLTRVGYYEITDENSTFSFEMPELSHTKTNFTTFVKTNDNSVYLGLNHSGLMKLNITTEDYRIYIPDTPSKNSYHALMVTSSGELASTSTYGTLIWDGNTYHNYIPWQHTVHLPDWRDDSDRIKFRWTYLKYLAGEQLPISIVEKENGSLIFPNSGIIPVDNYWLKTGAVIELNKKTKSFVSYGIDNNIIDGFWGINHQDIYSNYMVVNQIEKDKMGNIWVVNPFCEKNGNMVAIQSADDDSWSHVSIPDSSSFRPQTIAFDNSRRAWVGFAYEALEGRIYSDGGVKVFDPSDSSWIVIDNPEKLPGDESQASVWSLVFDDMNFLWVMNEKGIRGYEYSINDNTITLDPILEYEDGTALDLLAHVSYTKGNRIRVDSQNNKWVITHQGVWVIQESMVFWPSEEGLHPENSGLLSDIVYDVAFDNDKGLAYLATDKGISILQIPFADNPSKKQSMYISPNPFIIPDNDWVIIKNIPSGSIIKIMTVTGLLIKEINLPSNESQAIWDGTNSQGDRVGTAVYLVAAHHPIERNKVSKVAVIRK